MSMTTELINRLNAHAGFLEELCGFEPDGMVISDYKEAADTIRLLSEKLHVLQKDEWIPCEDRLPKKYGEYICTMRNGNVQECGFIPNDETLPRTKWTTYIAGWSTCEADGFKKLDYQDVVAWQPLPQSYQPKEDE